MLLKDQSFTKAQSTNQLSMKLLMKRDQSLKKLPNLKLKLRNINITLLKLLDITLVNSLVLNKLDNLLLADKFTVLDMDMVLDMPRLQVTKVMLGHTLLLLLNMVLLQATRVMLDTHKLDTHKLDTHKLDTNKPANTHYNNQCTNQELFEEEH